MINSNYNLSSVVLGIGIGLVAIRIINSQDTERAVNKISQASKSIYNSLTVDRVVTFTVTCMGVSLASAFAIPAIKDIFKQITN